MTLPNLWKLFNSVILLKVAVVIVPITLWADDARLDPATIRQMYDRSYDLADENLGKVPSEDMAIVLRFYLSEEPGAEIVSEGHYRLHHYRTERATLYKLSLSEDIYFYRLLTVAEEPISFQTHESENLSYRLARKLIETLGHRSDESAVALLAHVVVSRDPMLSRKVASSRVHVEQLRELAVQVLTRIYLQKPNGLTEKVLLNLLDKVGDSRIAISPTGLFEIYQVLAHSQSGPALTMLHSLKRAIQQTQISQANDISPATQGKLLYQLERVTAAIKGHRLNVLNWGVSPPRRQFTPASGTSSASCEGLLIAK